jgi:hypothetical protein
MRVEQVRELLARGRGAVPAGVVALLLLGVAPSAARAGEPAPGWELTAINTPTDLAPAGTGTIGIEVFNVGAGASTGAVTVTDTLPPGVTALAAGGGTGGFAWECAGEEPGEPVAGATIVTCTTSASIQGGGGEPNSGPGPNLDPPIEISVQVEKGAPEGVKEGLQANHVTIAGAGAPTPASTSDPVAISSQPAKFAFTNVDAWASNADGSLDTQAGSHPYELTLTFALATARGNGHLESAGGEARNIEVDLPPGLISDLAAVPQCNRQQFLAEDCPDASLIGVATAKFAQFGGAGALQLWDMVPPAGSPAEFAFTVEGTNVFADFAMRTGGDGGLLARLDDVPAREVLAATMTIWGDPADPSHDIWRSGGEGGCAGACFSDGPGFVKPVLTLPTDCVSSPSPSLMFSIRSNTWQNSETGEKSLKWHDANDQPAGMTGCEDLGFGPTIATAPSTSDADSPAGFTFELQAPLGGLEALEGHSTADIRDTTVTLPEGLTINPGLAAGLQACPLGPSSSEPGSERYGDNLPLPGENGEEERFDGPADCPPASQVGTVTAKTPLLEGAAEKQLEGDIYLLRSEPPNLELLLASSADGVYVKQVLDMHLNETTGQVTISTTEFPQIPVSDLKLSFSGGPQAALDTPAQCGDYTTTADVSPWAGPFIEDASPTAAFAVTAGPGGGGCPPNPPPFSPELVAGTTSNQAGGYSPFSATFSRQDSEQTLGSLSVTTPPGLLADLSSVPPCPEPHARQGTCAEASRIGSVTIAAGAGPDPLYLPAPGAPSDPIYLAGPYEGAPFSLSIVVPAIAGPFDLDENGMPVVIRARIDVNPQTVQLQIKTGPMPQILQGIPLQIKQVNLTIDRAGGAPFIFNPTNCEPLTVNGTLTSTQGAVANVSSHFQAGDCRGLKFTPKLTALTRANGEFAGHGASLHIVIAGLAGQANMRTLKVDLPQRLPARLETIQEACPESTFDANPAACPKAAVVGSASVQTPILSTTMTGPAYLVSKDGTAASTAGASDVAKDEAAFPDLVLVLQAQGVRIDLTGGLYVSEKNITSVTFRALPDVPIRRLDLILPEGKRSILAASSGLCTKKPLTMTTAITAQNGAQLKPTVKVAVERCKKPGRPGKKRRPHQVRSS